MRTTKWAAVLAAALLLGACGSAPTVSQQQRFDVQAARVTRVLFFYQDVRLEQTSSYKSGLGSVNVSAGETGLYGFGDALVKRCASALRPHGIAVEHASIVPAGEWRATAQSVFSSFGSARLAGATVITVKPVRGTAAASHNSARVWFKFEVRVVDAQTAKIAWVGQIDTETWKGRDAILSGIKGRTLDEEYADEFLAAIVGALKGASLL